LGVLLVIGLIQSISLACFIHNYFKEKWCNIYHDLVARHVRCHGVIPWKSLNDYSFKYSHLQTVTS